MLQATQSGGTLCVNWSMGVPADWPSRTRPHSPSVDCRFPLPLPVLQKQQHKLRKGGEDASRAAKDMGRLGGPQQQCQEAHELGVRATSASTLLVTHLSVSHVPFDLGMCFLPGVPSSLPRSTES